MADTELIHSRLVLLEDAVAELRKHMAEREAAMRDQIYNLLHKCLHCDCDK